MVRIFAAVCLAVVLAVQFPIHPDVPTSPSDRSDLPPVTFRTDATFEEVVAAGAQTVEPYGAFSIARGPPESLRRLQERGRYAESYAGAARLGMLGGPLEIATLAERPSAGWNVDGGGQSVGVVHFHGPIKSAWRDELASRGLSILRYLPHDAFIVRGAPSDIEGVRSVPAVDWVGPYASAWKIRPALARDGLIDVRIVVFPGASPESIVAWLAHRGVSTASGTGSSIAGSFGSGDFRWVRARIPSGLVTALAALPSVEFIDAVNPVHTWNDQTAWVLQTNATNNERYWSFGLDATGQVIGIADTGLDYDGGVFRESTGTIVSGDIYNTTAAGRRKVVRYLNMGVLTGQLTWPGGGEAWDPASIRDCPNGHGTGVASTLAGNDNGIGDSSNDGNALFGKIYMQDLGGLQGAPCGSFGSGETLVYVPENYEDLFGPAGLVYHDPVAPVRIHSDSWGSDSNVYDVQARMVDAFVWSHPDLTIVFAVGNCIAVGCPSAGSIGTPGTAKNILSVGGAYNPDNGPLFDHNDLVPESSRGPTLDGRIKPTIVTVFDGDSAMSDGDPRSNVTAPPERHWAGTSYSTPAAAAAAAIVRQYFTQGWYPAGAPVAADAFSPSAALVRAMMIASGVRITGSGIVSRTPSDTWPNNEQGFGRVLLSTVLPIAAAGDTFRTQVVDGTGGLLTGDEATYTFHVASPGPVKFVLTWSDYPGTLGAAKALVNDLDLEVTAPDGTKYRGNRFGPFAQGQSVPGGAFDTTNVEEAVILRTAMAGDWTVRAIASNVPVGPQPFALVATGSVDPAYGRMMLNRASYSERDTIDVAVEDSGAASVVVKVSSEIEPGGENVILTQAAADALWRGSITTSFGNATADGVLQVREGDVITAVYQDLSPAHVTTATAMVLASGPSVRDVRVTDISATGATIRWTTNEPATTEVRYGTSPTPLPFSEALSELRISHAIALTRLSADTVYYFEARSRGRHGNLTTEANGGLGHRFQTPPPGDVLLVVGGDSFPPEREASYAAALGGTGWTWSRWRVAELGLPNLLDLRDRRAVIWQTGLEQYPPFNASARALIKSYLDSGGRLLVSSHDTAWTLGDTSSPLASPFATAETVAWVRGVLKASFTCDPATITRLRGVGSDPVSGSYTGGVGYTAHRDGGADDQISPVSAGGTANAMWTDVNADTLCANQNVPAGLRWVAASANGTSGGSWGGTPSRLAYFAFEVTGIDATATDLNPQSATRRAILDAALRWLVSDSNSSLDRDHPDVNVTAPNGGVFSGSSIRIDWTAAAYGAGISIANFTLDVSADGGQSWNQIANVSGSTRTFTWNLGSAMNGHRYLVRITAHDSGTPSLRATDVTDTTLTLRRAGGDTQGPILWAGSVRVAPRPPGAALLATFNATADDRSFGGSRIAAAELFFRPTQPTPADTGKGRPMSPADGTFNAVVENVTWRGGLPIPPGAANCTWVHAKDSNGTWGPFASTCFVAIFDGPDSVVPAFALPDSVRIVNASQDLRVEWPPAWDEGLYGGTVAYRVFRATSPGGASVDASGPIPSNGSARYTFVDPGRGADASDYFYRIETVDAANNRANSTVLAAKIRVPFGSGLNLIGLPLQPTDPAFGVLAVGRPWSAAWSYDGCATGFPWSSALPSDGAGFAVPAGRGVWVNGTAADGIVALGVIAEIFQVRLCVGWNLIALPGLTTALTVASLRASTGAVRVMGFDPSGPYHLRDLGATEAIVAGRGYWIYVPSEVFWTGPGW